MSNFADRMTNQWNELIDATAEVYEPWLQFTTSRLSYIMAAIGGVELALGEFDKGVIGLAGGLALSLANVHMTRLHDNPRPEAGQQGSNPVE